MILISNAWKCLYNQLAFWFKWVEKPTFMFNSLYILFLSLIRSRHISQNNSIILLQPVLRKSSFALSRFPRILIKQSQQVWYREPSDTQNCIWGSCHYCRERESPVRPALTQRERLHPPRFITLGSLLPPFSSLFLLRSAALLL